MATKKTVKQYVDEARREGKCLVHPSHGAARKVYMLRHGPLDSDVAVCHTCDNPFCILDKHHFQGSWLDNVQDAVRKRRHACCRHGNASNRHILTEKDVIAIRKSAEGNHDLAEKYGVHHSTISKVRTRQNWSWL
jgi:hypothetical protein